MGHQRYFHISSWIVLLLALGLGTTGCSHNKPKADETALPSAAVDESELGSSDQGKAFGLQTVHFTFDSSLLNSEAKSVLAQNADVLKSHSSLKIQIEGHCDKRGGIQYNIALGEKRANSTKKYLEDLGVAGDRLTIISYGKEHPLASGDDEESYAKNRRANFVVTSK